MNLKGSFEPSSLASILQLLSNEQRTGALKLTNGQSEVKIFIKEGDVICAMGSQKETRLGTLLTREGLVSAKDLAYCLSVATETQNALGSVLVEKGFVSEMDLKKTIHRQAEEVIFNLFVWKSGEFEYHDSDDMPRGALDTKIDIMNIIMEAMRRIDEMVYFMTQIPSDRMVFELSHKLDGLEDIRLTGQERRFITFIDGRRTVRELIKAANYDDFSAYQFLVNLLQEGVIEKKEEAVVRPRAGGDDYSDIVGTYNDFLQVIRSHLEGELESWLVTLFDEDDSDPGKQDLIRKMHAMARKKWATQIIDSCKPRLVRSKRDLFADFNPTNPLDKNIRAVTRSLAGVRDSQKGRQVLAKSFSLLVANLVKTVVSNFGPRNSRKMLKELNQLVVAINESEREFPEKEMIVRDMMDILVQVAQYFKKYDRPAVTGGRLFSIREDNR